MQDMIDREHEDAIGCMRNARMAKRRGDTNGVKLWVKSARNYWHRMMFYQRIV